MRLALRIFVSVLAVSTSPGLVEMVDDGAHLLLDGHSDHAAGEDACPEHGCTPGSHHCGCCVSVPMGVPPLASSVACAERADRAWPVSVSVTGPRGIERTLDRPPAV